MLRQSHIFEEGDLSSPVIIIIATYWRDTGEGNLYRVARVMRMTHRNVHLVTIAMNFHIRHA